MKSYNRDQVINELEANFYDKLFEYNDYDGDDLITAWEAGYRKAVKDARQHVSDELRKVYDNLGT